jgi:hypothetical protein
VNRALIRKELRDQRSFVGLGIFLCVVETLEMLLLELPDQRPLWVNWNRELVAEGNAMVMLLIALAMAWGLLVREHDERTLEFLDGLPISRPAQFATKVVTALAVLMIYPVFAVGIMLIEHLLSRNSLDRSLHPQPLAMQLTMTLLASAVVLSVGMLLSFLRRLGWLVLAALLVGYIALEARQPWIRGFSPLQLLVPEYSSLHWRWPTRLLSFQLPVLAICLLGAGLLYNGRFEDWLRWLGRALSTRVAKVGIAISVAALFLIFGTTLASRYGARAQQHAADQDGDDDEEDEDAPGPRQMVEFAKPVPISSVTRHYRFSYLSSLQRRADPLLDRADGVFETVQRFFRAEPGDTVVADLTGSMTHTAGTAFWNTVRIDLSTGQSADGLAATLGHETTHVFVGRLSRGNESGLGTRLWTLDEGLASYVEYRFFHPDLPLVEHERIVAALRIRRQLRAEELIHPDLLVRDRGRETVYPLGRLFVEALVARHGDDAPARIFREAGRRDLPPNLDQDQLWNELFQANGYDLGLVVDDFYAAADRLARKHRAWVERLPRPRGAVEVRKGLIELKSSLDGPLPEGWSVVCRYRAAEDTPFDRYQQAFGHGGTFRWGRAEVSGQRIWFQLGLSDGTGSVLFEPWASVPLE